MRTATSKELQAIVDKIRDIECPDCLAEGRIPAKWPIESMDFDHLPQFKKIATISSLAKLGDLEILREELQKCEVVCSNHHRSRTVSRGVSEEVVWKLHRRRLTDEHKNRIGKSQRETIRRKSLLGHQETDKFGGKNATVPTEIKSRAARLGWERRRANPDYMPTPRDDRGKFSK